VFLNKFELLLNKLKQKINSKVIIAGDLNIDILKNTNASSELNRISSNNHLRLHIKVPTRKNACLDQIMSNIPTANCEILNLGLSDHETAQSLKFEICTKVDPPKFYYIKRRDYNLENINKFKECLKNLSWSDVYAENNANSAFTCFHDDLILFYKLCFPMKRIKISATTKPKTWFTTGIKRSTITKRQLRFNYYKCSRPDNNVKYLKYTKLLKKCIHQAQKITNIHYIYSSTNICKSTWNVIKNKTTYNPIDMNIDNLKKDNLNINKPHEIANEFNNFYLNVMNTKNNNTYDKSCNVSENYNFNYCSIFLTPTDVHEITKVINCLKNTNSTGYDEIKTNIIKESKNEIAPIIAYLINLCFTQGIFPDALKVSIIKPLHKKGNKDKVENYRPIALIPILSKVMEKVIYSRIIDFLNKYKILSSDQYGFLRGKSTTLATFSLVNTLLQYTDQRTPVTALFLDMHNAFDRVLHDKLLNKCYNYGIRGSAHDLLNSYLSNRTQYVEVVNIDNLNSNDVNIYKSETKVNNIGVPQGSILGPLLFLLYVNDLPNVTDYKCTLFADDISIIIPNKKDTIYNDEINLTLNKINNWLNINNLNINKKKTTYIQFLNKNGRKQSLSVTVDNELIVETNETKFLGIMLDHRCTWYSHINSVCSRIQSFVYALWRLVKISNVSTALQAYHGYVVSLLRYGIVVWGNSCHIEKVLIAQKACIRAIYNVDVMTSCRPLFKQLKILTVVSLYIYEICVFVKLHPELFNNGFRVNSRYPNKLKLPIITTTSYARNSFVMAINIFNHLQENVKVMPLPMFKTRLRKCLSEKCFYSLKEYFNSKILL
jgi:hypothetical protein